MTAAAKRFIGINLAPGVSGWNASCYFLACCIGIMLATFVPGMQPYLLTEFLKIPDAEQGRVTGQITFIGEVTTLGATMDQMVYHGRLVDSGVQ